MYVAIEQQTKSQHQPQKQKTETSAQNTTTPKPPTSTQKQITTNSKSTNTKNATNIPGAKNGLSKAEHRELASRNKKPPAEKSLTQEFDMESNPHGNK